MPEQFIHITNKKQMIMIAMAQVTRQEKLKNSITKWACWDSNPGPID